MTPEEKRQKEIAKSENAVKQQIRNIITPRTISKEMLKLSPWAKRILLLAIEKTELYKATFKTQAIKTTKGTMIGQSEIDLCKGTAQITTSELLERYTGKSKAEGSTRIAIKEATKEILSVQLKELKIKGKREIWTGYNVVETSKYDIDDTGAGTIYIKFSEIIAPILADKKEGYFKINPELIGKVKSSYTITWYMILQDALSRGQKSIRIKADTEEIKRMLGAEETKFDTKDLFKFYIKKPLEELNELTEEYKTTIERDGKGRSLKAYIINIETKAEAEKKQGLKILEKALKTDREKPLEEKNENTDRARQTEKELKKLGELALAEAKRKGEI